MIRSGLNCFALAASLLFVAGTRGATTNAVPDFREVYQLIHSNLAGVTEADLDHAALDGLLTGFDGRVLLEGNASEAATNAALVNHVESLEGGIGYVRVDRVADGLAPELASAVRALKATNTLKGLVLDLRSARGLDFAAAVSAADLFVARERLLLDWGAGSGRAQTKTNALTLPLAVLVNRNTRGAAEALAAVLREAGSGLLLGNTTAGRAMVMQDFTLKDGRHLRIATRPVKLGDGTELSVRGVTPDIQVTVEADAERAWLDNPYAMLSPTNAIGVAAPAADAPRHPRPSEADLVREKREEADPEARPLPVRPLEPETPQIRDPVLVRAVDLLKALAVVRDVPN